MDVTLPFPKHHGKAGVREKTRCWFRPPESCPMTRNASSSTNTKCANTSAAPTAITHRIRWSRSEKDEQRERCLDHLLADISPPSAPGWLLTSTFQHRCETHVALRPSMSANSPAHVLKTDPSRCGSSAFINNFKLCVRV